MSIVEELIEEANAQWREMHGQPDEDEEESQELPLPLVRLRVETSTPEGGSYECENPQRFSNRFVGKVANVNDVVQFHRKKKTASSRKTGTNIDESTASNLAALDTVKVEQLVQEFLASQSLSILPQNSFGDAVAQFIDKDDKHAMEMFVNESLEGQVKYLMSLDRDADDMDDEERAQSSLVTAMEKYRTQMETMFSKGTKKRTTRGKKRFKPKPDGWDTEFDGVWEDQPGALIHSDNEGDPAEEEAGEDGTAPARSRATTTTTTTRGRGRGRGAARGAAASSRATATKTGSARGRKKQAVSDDSASDNDVIMLDDAADDDAAAHVTSDDDDDSQALFVKQPRSAVASKRGGKTASTASATGRRGGRTAASPAPSSATVGGTATRRTARSAKPTQSTLNFASSQASGPRSSRPTRTARSVSVISDDIDDDDDDAFEPMQGSSSRRR
jgi:double-strand break repair protein MRE11